LVLRILSLLDYLLSRLLAGPPPPLHLPLLSLPPAMPVF
jgi:hypothetical protein